MNSFNSHSCIYSYRDKVSGEVMNWDMSGTLPGTLQLLQASMPTSWIYSSHDPHPFFHPTILRVITGPRNRHGC